MERIKFEKEDNRWYVVLPEWTGDKADLEMVCGADTFLDILSQGESEVYVIFSLTPIDGFEELNLVRLATELGNGAFYNLETYHGNAFNMEMWLCDVTKFVFGDFPSKIYFK